MAVKRGKAVWSAANTGRELADARRRRWSDRWALAGMVAAVIGAAVVLVLALTSCQPAPCASHGGLYMWSGNWDYCNDGSVQPAG